MYARKGTVKDNARNFMKIAYIPNNWKIPANISEMNKPTFINVDNPGDWDSFSFVQSSRRLVTR